MSELEKIQNAKLYIDKLARGINPVNDLPVDEQDIINDVHISRCFFYVAEVLERLAAEEEMAPAQKGEEAAVCHHEGAVRTL